MTTKASVEVLPSSNIMRRVGTILEDEEEYVKRDSNPVALSFTTTPI